MSSTTRALHSCVLFSLRFKSKLDLVVTLCDHSLLVVGCTRSNNDGNMFYFFLVPPSIYIGPSNKTVNESSDLALFCNATGTPPPKITWSKVAVPPVQLSFDEALTVNNINKTDSGVYQCRASNGIGSDVFASSFVTVRCKLKLSCFIGDITTQLEAFGYLERTEFSVKNF